MFNRLASYWYGSSQDSTNDENTEEAIRRRNEEVRQKRLQQLQGEDLSSTTPTSNEPSRQQLPSQESTGPSNIGVETPETNPEIPQHKKESIVTGSTVVKVLDPTSIKLWGESSKETEVLDNVSMETKISYLISCILRVTVTADQQPSTQPRYLTMLLDTGASTSVLSLDVLDEVLFERISMTAPELAECQVECGGRQDGGFQPHIMPYLLACIARADAEIRKLANESDVLRKAAVTCRKAALRMIGIVLLSNDSWEPQDPTQQLVEGMLPSESSFTLYSDTTNTTIFNEVLSQEEVTDDDLILMATPILACLSRKCTMASLSNSRITISLLHVFNILVANPVIAEVLPTLPGWLPHNKDDGKAYHNTLLGKFLCCSTIRSPPMHVPVPAYVSPFFNRSSALSPAITQQSMEQYQAILDNIQNATSKLLYLLMKSKSKDAVLDWISNCIEANSNRAKLAASFMAMGSASDGFMLNLAAVLVKLCIPFLNPKNPKLQTIDVRFTAPNSKSLLLHSGVDRILDKDMLSEADIESIGQPESFNFVTFCFYATHRALQLAYTSPFDKYRQLMKSLMETQQLLDSGGGRLSQEIRGRFEDMFIEQLEVKTHLLHPDVLSQVLLFYTTSASWLCHISLNPGVPTVPDIRRDIITYSAEEPSKMLAMVPSYFISSTCQFLINARYFAESNLENFVSENLDYLIEFLMVFCNSKWVPNPHTRAEIVEALTVFIPNHRTKSSVSTANRERAFCSNSIAVERLGRSLIALFVDVEHGAEFQYKFQYRYHIFEILEYAWVNNFNIHKLSLEVRNREEDTTVLFTRFIKLILNDANFLMDEALHGLDEIKKIEVLQDDEEEWNKLDSQTKQSKLRTLTELKRMCTSHNILASETIKCINYMTSQCNGVTEEDRKHVTFAFVTPLLCDTFVTMLNYYLKELVADTQVKYKIKRFEDVKFRPALLLQSIVSIYINMKHERSFLSAISRDGRSYYPGLFTDTATKLNKLMVNDDVISELQEVSVEVEKLMLSQENEELLCDRAPSHFLDPILGTLMSEPVLLPTSKVIVDRCVIAKHLLSDPIDPFNRQPLSMADVVPQLDLKNEITLWRSKELEKMNND